MEGQQALPPLILKIIFYFSCVSSILDQSSSPQARVAPPKQSLPSCPGTRDGDWLLGLVEATVLDNAQAVSEDVRRDFARLVAGITGSGSAAPST